MRWLALFAVLLLAMIQHASAQNRVESSKLKAGGVLQGAAEEASKLKGGAVLQNTTVQSSKLNAGAILQNSAAEASKLVGYAVLQTSYNSLVPRAPLTHW